MPLPFYHNHPPPARWGWQAAARYAWDNRENIDYTYKTGKRAFQVAGRAYGVYQGTKKVASAFRSTGEQVGRMWNYGKDMYDMPQTERGTNLIDAFESTMPERMSIEGQPVTKVAKNDASPPFNTQPKGDNAGVGSCSATGTIVGGSNAAPMMTTVNNKGDKWLSNMPDNRKSELQRWIAPYYFYTYYMKQNFTMSQTMGTSVLVTDQKQIIKEVFRNRLLDVKEMVRITPAVAASFEGSSAGPPGFQGVHSSMNGWVSGSKTEFCVPVSQDRFTIRNSSNRRTKLKIYEYTCKMTHRYGGNKPSELVNKALARKAIANNPETIIDNYGGFNDVPTSGNFKHIGQKKLDFIGQGPMGKELGEQWVQTGLMDAYILPGRNFRYISTQKNLKMNRVEYDQMDTDLSADATAGDWNIAGWTKCYLIIAHGDRVASATSAEKNAASDFFLNVDVDYQFGTSFPWRPSKVKHSICSQLIATTGDTSGEGVITRTVPSGDQVGCQLTPAEPQLGSNYANNSFGGGP